MVRSEGFHVNENSNDTSWDRTSEIPICSAQHLNHCATAVLTVTTSLLVNSKNYLQFSVL